MQDSIECQRLWRPCGWLPQRSTRAEAGSGAILRWEEHIWRSFMQMYKLLLDDIILLVAGVLVMLVQLQLCFVRVDKGLDGRDRQPADKVATALWKSDK
jgi:hypothetical protein